MRGMGIALIVIGVLGSILIFYILIWDGQNWRVL